MAHILGLENVGITLGARPILTGITLGIEAGQRIGVVGPNGAGKSTILKLLSGKLLPDEGRVTKTREARVVVLTQEDNFLPSLTGLEVIHPGKAEHEWATDPLVRDIHQGLLAGINLHTKVSLLSGGQRRRVAIAAAICAPREVLVLDEPTNHLDVEGVAWLAEHLASRYQQKAAGAIVVVTHDRWFIDAVCTIMWEVVPGHDGAHGKAPVGGYVQQYEGGYAAYVIARAERQRQALMAEEKRQNLLRKELAWLRRGAPARTSKPRFRIEAAQALIENVPPLRDSVSLSKTAMQRLGKDVLDLENVTFGYPVKTDIADSAGTTKTESVLFSDLTWRLAPGERVGVVGVNGAGKSTLLTLLSGQLQPQKGRLKTGKTVRLRMLSQDTKEIDAVNNLRVVEAVAQVREYIQVGKQEYTAAQLVEKLGFTRERAWTVVADISGGERRRIQIIRLLVDDPNVLLLDEPTNDLDTDTLVALEDLLDQWPGTIVVVSHDRYLLERITDHQVAIFGDGTIRDLPGGVEQYLQMRASGEMSDLVNNGKTHLSLIDSSTEDKSANAVTRLLTPGSAQERQVRKEVNRIERAIAKLGDERTALGIKMAEISAAGDFTQLASLGKQDQELASQHDALELQWIELMEQLEE